MLTAQERDVLQQGMKVYSPTEIEDFCIVRGTMLIWNLSVFEDLLHELKSGNPVDKNRVVYQLNTISKMIGKLMLELQWFGLLIEGPDLDPAVSQGRAELLKSIGHSCSWEMREKYYYE